MAGKAETGALQHRLVDRCGDQGGGFAGHAGLHRDLDRFGDARPISAVRLAGAGGGACGGGDQCLGVAGENPRIAHQLQGAGANAAAEMIECGARHFRADAGRLAHGDEDWGLTLSG